MQPGCQKEKCGVGDFDPSGSIFITKMRCFQVITDADTGYVLCCIIMAGVWSDYPKVTGETGQSGEIIKFLMRDLKSGRDLLVSFSRCLTGAAAGTRLA